MSVNSSKTSVIYRRLLRYVLLKFEGQQSLARWSIKMSPAAADVAVVLSLFSARHVTLKIAAVALLLDRFASWLTDNISYLFLHIIILITSHLDVESNKLSKMQFKMSKHMLLMLLCMQIAFGFQNQFSNWIM